NGPDKVIGTADSESVEDSEPVRTIAESPSATTAGTEVLSVPITVHPGEGITQVLTRIIEASMNIKLTPDESRDLYEYLEERFDGDLSQVFTGREFITLEKDSDAGIVKGDKG